MFDHLIAFDKALFLIINRDLTNPILDAFFSHITNGNFWIIPVAVATLAMAFRLRGRLSIALTATAMVAVIVADQLLSGFVLSNVNKGIFWLGPGVVAALFVLPRLGWRKALPFLALVAVTVTLTDQLATSLIKPLVHRLRPCNPQALVDHGRFLLGYKTSFSFPSNHAMNMFGQATLLAFLYRRYAVYFFLFAAFIAYSRVYVGVHYPLDVIGGAIFGIICGAAVYAGYTKGKLFFAKYRKRKSGQDQKEPSGTTTRKP
jgi:membrane-associated phospholipid phosphatase